MPSSPPGGRAAPDLRATLSQEAPPRRKGGVSFSGHEGYSRPVSILNRRNALLGWTVWQATKAIAKRKAKQAVPTVENGTGRKKKAAVAAAVVGAGAALMFWRKRASPENGSEPPG